MSNPTANVKLALEELRDELMASYDPSKPCVTVCAGTGCCASGALEVKAALDEEIKKQGADVHVDIKITGCRGFCEQGPLVAVLPTKIFYTKVKQSDAAQVLDFAQIEQNEDKTVYEEDSEN